MSVAWHQERLTGDKGTKKTKEGSHGFPPQKKILADGYQRRSI